MVDEQRGGEAPARVRSSPRDERDGGDEARDRDDSQQVRPRPVRADERRVRHPELRPARVQRRARRRRSRSPPAAPSHGTRRGPAYASARAAPTRCSSPCALAGCGSMAAAELPAPAGAPARRALAERPAGRSSARRRRAPASPSRPARPARRRGRSARTCREPIAVAMLDRGKRDRGAVRPRAGARDLRRDARSSGSGGPAPGSGRRRWRPMAWSCFTSPTSRATRCWSSTCAPLRADPPRASDRRTVCDRLRPGALGPVDRARRARNQLVNYAAGNRPVIARDVPSIRTRATVVRRRRRRDRRRASARIRSCGVRSR